MHILTSDTLTKSQLSLLLRDLGHAPSFHTELSDLLKATEPSQQKAPVLIDLQFELNSNELESIRSKNDSLRLIGFERFDNTSAIPNHIPANSFPTSIIIPNHAERAKLRLKNALRAGSASKRTSQQQATRPPFSFRRRESSPKLHTKRAEPTNTTSSTARYLVAHSLSSRKLLEALKGYANTDTLLILEAHEDVEFEIIARELNFQSNADTSTLHLVNNERLRIDHLEKLEREANRSKTKINCYVGRTDDLDEAAASELKLFSEYLSNLRNPHARLLIGYEVGSEEFYQNGVNEHLAPILNKADRIRIPNLVERVEDIPTICQLTLSFLRTAHPFLTVQRISKDAEMYLSEQRQHYSYTKLVRILRNAIALSKRDSLSIEDIKNYGESDMTTQHLLETMADENYFPQSANF